MLKEKLKKALNKGEEFCEDHSDMILTGIIAIFAYGLYKKTNKLSKEFYDKSYNSINTAMMIEVSKHNEK